MSTTALTPTHHGGFIRAAVSIAVAIAIPIAAPAIVTSLAGSIALSTMQFTLASAVVGSALGALAAKVTGADWKMGAIGGAIGGGLGGFAETGGFSGIGGRPIVGGPSQPPGLISAGMTSPAAITSVGLNTGVSPRIMGGPGGFDAFGNISYGDPYGPAGFAADPVLSFPSGSLVPPQPQTVPFDVAGGSAIDPWSVARRPVSLTDPATTAPSSSQFYDQGFGVTEPTMGTQLGGTPAAPGAGAPDYVYDQGFGVTEQTMATPVPAAKPGFFDEFGKKLTAGVKRAFDPENLAQKGLEAAGKFGLSKAAEYFADEVPVSREEEQRLAFLDQQRAEQVRLQGEKEKIATGFLSQARGISGTGQEESNRAKIAAARAGRSYIRGGSQTPAALASRQRQVSLAAARAGGTAQVLGRTSAEKRKADLFSKAAGVLPTGSALATGAASDLKAAEKRFLRQQEEQGKFSDQFGGLLPTGAKTAAERAEEIKKELGL